MLRLPIEPTEMRCQRRFNIALVDVILVLCQDLALLAWAQEAKIMARSIETEPINIKGLINIIPEIRKMTLQKPNNFCPRLKSLLAENGIALVFLPHLKGSFLQGASFMDGNKIVVGITARGKDADKFWFSLFHELGHIVLGHVGKADGTTSQDESDADVWSRDELIPLDLFDSFKENQSFSAASIQKFAKENGIAPGIVVGRLQNEGNNCLRTASTKGFRKTICIFAKGKRWTISCRSSKSCYKGNQKSNRKKIRLFFCVFLHITYSLRAKWRQLICVKQ